MVVMMTGAGAPGMPGILKCMKSERNNMRLIGADADGNAPSRKDFDAFYVIPRANDECFIDSLLKICIDEKVDLLIPVVTRELLKLSNSKQLFSRSGIDIAVMEPDKLNMVNNKGLLFQALVSNGFDMPPFYITENLGDVKKAIDLFRDCSTGIVIKPVEGNGSRGVRIIDKKRSDFDAYFYDKPDGMHISADELLRILSEKEQFPVKLIVMKYLPGREFSVDMVAQEGKVQAVVCRVGLQVVSSNQTSSVVVDEPNVINLCCDIAEKFRLSGNIGFDLKEDEDGKIYVIEVNPRLTGGIVTCLAAGANMPILGVKSWKGEMVEQPNVRYGVKMQRYWNETFYDENDEEIKLDMM